MFCRGYDSRYSANAIFAPGRGPRYSSFGYAWRDQALWFFVGTEWILFSLIVSISQRHTTLLPHRTLKLTRSYQSHESHQASKIYTGLQKLPTPKTPSRAQLLAMTPISISRKSMHVLVRRTTTNATIAKHALEGTRILNVSRANRRVNSPSAPTRPNASK